MIFAGERFLLPAEIPKKRFKNRRAGEIFRGDPTLLPG